MKNWFRRQAIKMSLRKIKRPVGKVNYGIIKKVAIVASVNNTQQYKQLLNVVSDLQKSNKKVTAIVYLNQKVISADYAVSENVVIIKKDEFNWFGKPKSVFVTDFLKAEFDLLFEFDLDNLYAVEYTVALCLSKTKVGSTKGNVKYLDLMIEQEQLNIQVLFAELLRYLNMMNN